MSASEECPVRVAVRREKEDLCRLCVTSVPGEPQVLLGDDRSFTYDFLFDEAHTQCTIYAKCVHDLVERCFDGLNATVLAYGQTGSGKTYTMGTGLDNACGTEQGIIPRAIDQMYNSMERRISDARGSGRPEPSFSLEAQFIEIYNDEVIDLLDTRQGEEKKRRSIHEDKEGNIHLRNATTVPVNTSEEAMRVLRIGAVNRTTGCTLMNEQSSRSHAMFTLKLTIKSQNELVDVHTGVEPSQRSLCPESVLFAKLNFVDLAGSERVKRTGATGRRAKEGISINSGLLALGNVISALGDRSLKATHVPYRDSKLTRLLQDSLGGNSRTLMIACVGPSDCDFIETLNTLKYANRARNIRNKVTVNQHRSSMLVSDLQLRLRQLEQELSEFRLGQRSADDFAYENQLYEENLLLANEVKTLNLKVRWLQNMVNALKRDAMTTPQEAPGEVDARERVLENGMLAGNDEPTPMEPRKREYINESVADISEPADIYGQTDIMTASSASDSSHPQLMELQNEIAEREREIRRLQASREHLLNAKVTYEARLEELTNRIRKTEMERDQAMSLIRKSGNAKTGNGEREQELKREYERKLGAMRAELRRLSTLKKENEKLLKEQSKNLSRIAALQSRLDEVKTAKRELLQQIKASAREILATERHREKQIRSLQRESLKKDMCIRSLRTEKERAAAVLRQKQQEVSALRRRSRSALDLNGHRAANATDGREQDVLWRQVRAQLHECIAKREASIEVECDYDQLLEKRKSVSKSLASLKEKRKHRESDGSVGGHTDRIEDEVDCLEANLTYIEKCIHNCEQRIVAADEHNAHENRLYSLFDSCQSMRKAKALMKKLSSATLLQAQVAASRKKKMDILDAKVQQLTKEKRILEQLLVHVVKDSSQVFPDAQTLLKALSNFSSTESEASGSQQSQPSKARQRMATAAQLLYPEDTEEHVTEAPSDGCRTRECSPEPGCSFDVLDSGECFPTNEPVGNTRREDASASPVDNEKGEIGDIGPPLSRLGLVKPDKSPVQKVHADGSSFSSLSRSGRLVLWDAETLTGFHIPSSDLVEPRDLKLNLNLNQFYVATRSGIDIRDTRTWRSTCTLSASKSMTVSEPSPQIPFIQVDCMATLPYVFGTTKKSLHVWDIRNLQEVANLCMAECCFDDDFTKVYVIPSGQHRGTALLAGNQFIRLLGLDTSKNSAALNHSLELAYPLAGDVRALAAIESLLFVVVEQSLLRWDISSNAHDVPQMSHCSGSNISCLAPFQVPKEGCRWLTSADESGTLRLWVPDAMTLLGHVVAHRDCVNCLSSTSELLFTASSDSTVAIWKHARD